MEASGSKDNRSSPGKIIWNASDDMFEFFDTEIENADAEEAVIKQPVTNESREGLKLPRETENVERKYGEEIPLMTCIDEYQDVFRVPGQMDEAGQSVGQEGGSNANDVRTLSASEWGKDGEQERKARQKLHERDRNSVEYSKSLLYEGDTLVYVSYPGGITFYDSNGKAQPYKIYRASSEKLKALGSAKFSRMFEERPQYWARKRKGLLHHLPDGIRYVLDLTPLEEGDEAVELVSELSCSAGIRNWYLAETRCGVEKHLVAGDDDVPGPAIVPARTAEQFGLKVPIDGYITFLSSKSSINSPVNDRYLRTSLGRTVPNEDAFSCGKSFQDSQMQRAIKNSLEGGHLFVGPSGSTPVGTTQQDSTDAAGSKKKVLDYCPIRHRFGVENLLRIIQGKAPELDSAPKVWTLFVLAKYYECTSVVIDYITSWIMNGNNIKFLEILPEASINIGLGLKSPMITRAAFSILVSEEALNVASRTLCENHGDRRAGYKYLRPREELDEDLWNVIQHASQDFCDRIQKTITDLLDERMAWFLELPEYRKICKFEDYCYKKKDKSKKEEAVYERRKSVIQQLLVDLRRYVRGKIISCLNQGLTVSAITMVDKSQREAQWEMPESNEPPDANYIYNGLGDRERVLLPHFWRRLRDVYWEDDFDSPILEKYNPQLIRSGKSLVDRDHLRLITTSYLETHISEFNREVNLAVDKENYNPSPPSNPLPTIPPTETKSLDEERPNYAFMSAYNQDHAYHQARLAGIRALELELAEVDEKTDDAASISSVSTDASTKPLLDLPLRSKKNKVTVENKKDESDPNAQPGPSTMVEEKPENSVPKVLENFLQHMGKRSLTDYKEYRAAPLTGVSYPNVKSGSTLLSKDIPNFAFANTSIPFSANSNPVQPNEPSHNFKLCCFLDELASYIDHICHSMLSKSDGSELTMLTDTLLCLTDKEWQYLPLWAGGNDDGSGGVTSADVPPAYYANVGGLTPGVMYKGARGFVGVGTGMGSERNSSLDVKDGSARTETEMGAGSQVGSQVGMMGDDGCESDTGSIFSTGSYDMAAMTPTGSGSESDFEIVGSGEDEGLESGDDFTIDGDNVSVSQMEMSDGEIDEENREKGKGKGKEIQDEDEDGGVDDMDWTDQEGMELEDGWEGSFTD
ncbi:hypothetical protein ACHAPF_007744 [Botrytis cinerea]